MAIEGLESWARVAVVKAVELEALLELTKE